MGSAVVNFRAARPADLDRLRELTFESKAHRGYECDFVRRWADGLGFERDEERWPAEVDGDPPAMGRGVGTRLFRLAADRARDLGAERLDWGAEPNALGFYEKLGGRKLRDHVTEWGRVAPWMGLDL